MNSIRTKSDLTGRSGEILFFEYSEQYPILLNEIGMFSKIRTYLRPVDHFEFRRICENEFFSNILNPIQPELKLIMVN